jgi:hypothetical protein
MDDFRRIQKKDCLNGSRRGGRRPYGCYCCRRISNLNFFKKWSRRTARRRLRQTDASRAA